MNNLATRPFDKLSPPRIIKTNMAKETQKKPMTLEDFAAAVHRDYLALTKDMVRKSDIRQIREEMATKADLWPMQRDIKTLDQNVRDLRSDVKMITDSMVSKADLANTLGEELGKSEYARHIDDLRNRVDILERKLRVKPTHRAA
jgi:hypothetical protein